MSQPKPAESHLTGSPKWRLIFSITTTLFMLQCLYAAVIKVFLPNQVADIDLANKVNNLAIIYALMSLFTTVATPLAGALSDRTRTVWGRRTPFIAIASLIAALLTMGLSLATTLLSLTVLWIAAAFCFNMMQVPMMTLIADRFAPLDRGTASGFVGAGMNIGISIGVIVAGYFVQDRGLGYVIFSAAVVMCCIAFVLLNREPSSRDIVIPPFRLGAFLTSFWVDPRQHPDFAWAFLGRFFMYMGYTLVSTYLLYILQDYIGLDRNTANRELGRIFSIQLVGLLFCGLFGGIISDKTGRRKPLIFLATLLIAVAFSVPLLMPTIQGMYIFAAIVGMGYGAFTSVDMALMTQVLPKRDHSAGKDLGLLIIGLNIPLILGPVVAALLLGWSGQDYRILFGVGIVLVVFSAFLVLPIKSTR
jgi:MFS family permease